MAKPLKIDTPVRVNDGTVGEHMSQDISGWCGRVIEHIDDHTVRVAWDSLTLKGMDTDYIRACRKKRQDWTTMDISATAVRRAGRRDNAEDVKETIMAIEQEFIIGPLRSFKEKVQGWFQRDK